MLVELGNCEEFRRLLTGGMLPPLLGDGHCSPQERAGAVPLLGQEVIIDDNDAAMVLVFPKEKSVGGTVDTTRVIKEPLEASRRIFLRRQNTESCSTMDSGFRLLASGPVREGLYQSVVRAGVIRVLAAAGFSVSAFRSIDGDETFLKISLPLDGSVIKSLAQRYHYKVPFEMSAYQDMPPEGTDYKGHAPMKNAMNHSVMAYTQFDSDIQGYLQPFRHIDVVRIVHKCLDEWLDLSEMVNQNVIARYFAAAQFDQVQRLHEKWGTLSKLVSFPTHRHEEELRNYFGEMITFYVRWFCFYTRMLAILGTLGALCTLRLVPFFGLSLEHQRYIQVGFAFVLTCWAAVFNEAFQRRAARARQRWGMKDWEHFSLERPQYRPDIEGSIYAWCMHTLADGIVVAFSLSFACLILGIQAYGARRREEGDMTVESYGAMITVGLIKLVNVTWNYVAPALVNMKNLRTEAQWNDALTRTLSSVKIFVALFPFVNDIFLKKFFEPTCSPEGTADLAYAAWKVYGPSNSWPPGIAVPRPVSKLANGTVVAAADGALAWLHGFTFESSQGQQCIFGCYPVVCHDGSDCITNCTVSLERNLLLVYVVHVLCTVLFLVIPIVLTKRSVNGEILKVRRSQGVRPYTFMQFQAKCCEAASYQYGSWGGSLVEDFLELAIGFALLTCFGMALPSMSFLALLSHIVEYRLMAYRMTNVTCRPFPAGSEGIGVWQSVFETICEVAIVVNVGNAVFMMHPMRLWPWGSQLVAFILLEHAMLFLRRAIKSMIPPVPYDVHRIEDFNLRFKSHILRRFDKYAPVTIAPEKRADIADIDIDVGPSAVDAYVDPL